MTVIAVDGPAASGKGTLARKLAAHFGYDYLDTGKLYRATGLAVLNAGKDPSDETAAVEAANSIDPARLDDPALSGDDAAAAASKVAAIGAVRAALKDFQIAFAARRPGAVLDGRDIGTVICPDAPAKLFVTASVEVRAERRHKELLSRGEDSIYARVLQELRERDERDTNRADAPLRPADDAQVLDTSAMSIDEAFAEALKIVEGRLA
ncbi:(d)CMP kinase [Hwanghaeella sp.]|uniref:(d)CMP kinase n=1 Tax=Hwanghaeella sp. TaxID=2605943 RepID=UPI003CCBAF3C